MVPKRRRPQPHSRGRPSGPKAAEAPILKPQGRLAVAKRRGPRWSQCARGPCSKATPAAMVP